VLFDVRQEMNKEKLIDSLELFVEKADRLVESNFVKNAVSGSGVNLSWFVGKPVTVKRSGPDQENIDAFVLTFRFFIQDNERISLREFARVFQSSFVLAEESTNFDKARIHVNSYLDSATMFDLGGRLSRRELMDVFIYGGLSHANQLKKQKYDAWMASNVLAPFVQNEFVVILYEVLNVIAFIKNQSLTILERVKEA